MKNISKIKSKEFDENSGKFEVKIEVVDNNFLSDDGNEEVFDVGAVDEVILAEEKINVNGNFAIEGELISSNEFDNDLQIDLTGNLLISGKGYERYEVNEMGELIFNY